MKKLLLTALCAVVVAGLGAQGIEGLGSTVEPVNVKKLQAAIAKSDADIADAKKNIKAATWIKRGEVFMEADSKPVNGLFASMDEGMLKSTFGAEATPTQETLGANVYQVYTYEHFKAYVRNGKVEFFVPTTIIDPAALDKAYDAYTQAYTLDAKGSQKKVAAGMNNLHNRSFENGGTRYSLGDYKGSSENFRRAWKASAHPTSTKLDTMALYYTGMTGIFASDFRNALDDLDKTLEMGYDAGGEVYRLKFLALYNLNEKEKSLDVLKQGIKLYPSNEELIDITMKYYGENEGDPSNLIPLVQDAIAKNPTNSSLFQGLARIYDKLGQSDNAIDAALKSVSLTPDDFFSNYLEGWFIIKKGDAMNEALGKMNITSRKQYQDAQADVNKVFMGALAPLEKAYSLDPSEAVTVELLKNLTFRLRDEPGMNEKYEKYSALFNSMNQK